VDLKISIGKPFEIKKNVNPTWREVEEVQSGYIAYFSDFYQRHAPKGAGPLEIQ
jgi:hypothetical protein